MNDVVAKPSLKPLSVNKQVKEGSVKRKMNNKPEAQLILKQIRALLEVENVSVNQPFSENKELLLSVYGETAKHLEVQIGTFEYSAALGTIESTMT